MICSDKNLSNDKLNEYNTYKMHIHFVTFTIH